jgi:hypothetical protein
LSEEVDGTLLVSLILLVENVSCKAEISTFVLLKRQSTGIRDRIIFSEEEEFENSNAVFVADTGTVCVVL